MSDWYSQRQFAYWMLVSVPLFVVIVLTLQVLHVPIWVAFVAGIFFDTATKPVLEWLTEWREAEKTVNGVNTDA